MSDHRRGWSSLRADVERAMTPGGRSDLGRYVIEGTRLHERALRSGMRIDGTLVAEGWVGESKRAGELLRQLRESDCDVRVAPDAALDRLTAGRSIGAIVSLVRLPRPADLGGVARSSQARILVAKDVEDPGNVGALVRTALASNAAALVAIGISDPFHPRAVRTSMGSLFKLPILSVANVEEIEGALDRMGVERVGAVSENGVPLPQLRPSGRVALFLGSEAFGLDDRTRARMDRLVTIPMRSGVDSLSVNAAAAVILYALRWPR